MTVTLVIMEGIILSFWLLLVCVVGIANGPAGLACFYEKNVQERVVELGLTTKKKIDNAMISGLSDQRCARILGRIHSADCGLHDRGAFRQNLYRYCVGRTY